jgi:hypothetical protein
LLQQKQQAIENLIRYKCGYRFIVEKIRGELRVEDLRKKELVELLAARGYESDPVRRWKERVVKEKGYLHETSTVDTR